MQRALGVGIEIAQFLQNPRAPALFSGLHGFKLFLYRR